MFRTRMRAGRAGRYGNICLVPMIQKPDSRTVGFAHGEEEARPGWWSGTAGPGGGGVARGDGREAAAGALGHGGQRGHGGVVLMVDLRGDGIVSRAGDDDVAGGRAAFCAGGVDAAGD